MTDSSALTSLLGEPVKAASGESIGRLVDITVDLGEAHPAVRRIVIGRGRQARAMADWRELASFAQGDVRLGRAVQSRPDLEPSELRLARDVLDTQVVDVAGKRLARVSEVILGHPADAVVLLGVDIGTASILRRMGAGILARRMTQQVIDWPDVHPLSSNGHALALATPNAGVHRLRPAEMAALLSRLPAERATDVLHAVTPQLAAETVQLSHPRVGAGLLRGLPERAAASVAEQLPVDDAAALLRALPTEHLMDVLAEMPSSRAGTLRRLLAHPADRAGGLMNPKVRTARIGEPVDEISARFATDPPGLATMATVFVLDERRRPVGMFEPADLLAGATEPRPARVIPVGMPVEEVIGLFALHDVIALPVTGETGAIVGAIAATDVLDELLAERLPDPRRFARIRRRSEAGRRSDTRRRRARGADTAP